MTAPPRGQGLVARTVALPGPGADPLSLAGADGVLFASPSLTLVGWGEGLCVPLPGGLAEPASRDGVRQALGALEVRDALERPGTGPVAVGALPFSNDAPGRLVVPSVLVGRDDQGTWLTLVGERTAEVEAEALLDARRRALAHAPRRPPVGPVATEVTPHPPPEVFSAAVAEAVAAIRAGGLRKVVLARCLEVALAGRVDPVRLAGELRALDPTSTAFCLPDGDGHFVGASPELVVARSGRQVRCQPLAGTAPLSAGDLLSSKKNREEHQLVVDAVRQALAGYAEGLSVPEAPEVLALGTDARLSTTLTATLAHEGGPDDALELLASLHPTPAVGGVPTATALAMIDRLEPLPRQGWAGPVGWQSANGDGAFVLGIRSVLLRPGSARIWAGAGVVAGSDPEEELAETTLKLEPVRRALDGATAPEAEGSGAERSAG